MATQPALVLLMENDVALKAAITDILSPHFRLASAVDGDAGLERLLALEPDLVVWDVRVPGLSSESLLAEVRRHPGLSDLPVVCLIADGHPALRWRLLKLGAQACISTTGDAEELLAHVGGPIYARRRANSELQRYQQIVATSGDMLVFIDRALAGKTLRVVVERRSAEAQRRGLDMIKPKKQVNALSLELGREAPFPPAFLREPPAGEPLPPRASTYI